MVQPAASRRPLTAGQPSSSVAPGMTASGIASASQVVERTPAMMTTRVDATASARPLLILAGGGGDAALVQEAVLKTPLTAAEYPILADLWDNNEDAIFDNL